DEEDTELAKLETERQRRAQDADQARKQRDRVLARLDSDSKKRGAELQRLQKDRQQTETFLAELRRRAEAVPFDPNDAFAKLRGKLSWPVAGSIELRFGEPIVQIPVRWHRDRCRSRQKCASRT